MIRISAKPNRGFYRAGIFHPHDPKDHTDDAFTAEQLEALEAEDMLTVQHIEGDPENAPPAAAEDAEAVAGRATLEVRDGLAAREKALDSRESAFNTRENDLASRESQLTSDRADVEKAAGEVEERIAAIRLKEWMLSDPSFREARLKLAIKKVVEGKGKGDFRADGEPTTDAVELEAGEDITAAERSQWYAELYPPVEA